MIQFLTLRGPLRRKLTPLPPTQIFDAHLLKNTNLSPSSFHVSVDFISRSCFESDGFIAYSKRLKIFHRAIFRYLSNLFVEICDILYRKYLEL